MVNNIILRGKLAGGDRVCGQDHPCFQVINHNHDHEMEHEMEDEKEDEEEFMAINVNYGDEKG